VLLAVHGAVPFKPDVVVSGINRGANLGTDLVYSGTAAAARQAVMCGIPGIALSLAVHKPPFRFGAIARLAAARLDYLLANMVPDSFVNLNAPDSEPDKVFEIKWSNPCRRIYKDTMKVHEGPDGFSYCFYTDGHVLSVEEDDSDEHAVRQGFAAASLIAVYPQALPGADPSLPSRDAALTGALA
jgi:5'-nucleotidase